MTRWFWEERTMTGRWTPVTAPARPETVSDKDGLRLHRVGGTGPRIRRFPVMVEPEHQDLPLGELATIYGGTA